MALSMIRFVAVACAGCCHTSTSIFQLPDPASMSRPAKDKLPEGIPQDISDGGVALGSSHCDWAKCTVQII